jgi:hypothetical protein
VPQERTAEHQRVLVAAALARSWARGDPGDYRALPQDEIRLDRRRPPDGSRHLITIAELRRFIAPRRTAPADVDPAWSPSARGTTT